MAAPNLCSVDGCDNPSRARGVCNKHYYLLRVNGDPLVNRKKESKRFLEHAAKVNTDECLLWPFTRNAQGYAVLKINGRFVRASRAVCIATHGEPPGPRYYAAHSCGNGHLGCVNPRHLHWATPKQNVEDAFLHGRRLRKAKKAAPKPALSASNILNIRSDTRAADIVASEYGLSAEVVQLIRPT